MDISGLHIFGNLTTKAKSSKTVEFKTVDADNNGAITKTEWEKATRLYKCDTLEFSFLDKNGDGEISEEEFAAIKQNVQLQKKLDSLVNKYVSKDFGGIDAEYLPEMVELLKDFALEYAEMHDGEEDIASTFEEELLAFYKEQKEILLENAPSRIQSRVLDNVYETLVDDFTPKSVKNAIFAEMEKVANEYTKKHYTDPTYEEDLEAYISNYINTSDVEKLQAAWDVYNEKQASYKEQVDASELERLKYDAETFLKAALDNFVEVKLGNTTIKNVNSISTALKKYKNAEALRADMQAIYDSLSTVSKRDEIEIKTCAKETESIAKNIKTDYNKAVSTSNSLESAIKSAEEMAGSVDSQTLAEILSAARKALEYSRSVEEEIKKLLDEAEDLKARAAEANSAAEAEMLLNNANNLLEQAESYREILETLNTNAKQVINTIAIAGINAAETGTTGSGESKTLSAEEKYAGINVGKNLYDKYGLKVISDNKNLTSKNLQVANYSLNADGTINVNSLHSELKLVYNNLQKYVLEYYNSSEEGKAALKALGGEANLRKIVDAAWQNRAISQSWTNKEVNMDDFVKSVFGIYEEMIRSIEVDSKCLERLTAAPDKDKSIEDIAKEACGQHGNLKCTFTLTADETGLLTVSEGRAEGDAVVGLVNTIIINSCTETLKSKLQKMYPWIDKDLFEEDFSMAQMLALRGIANAKGGDAMTVTLEDILKATARYFMAYVNQDYRNNSNAQNMDLTKDW